MAFNGASDGEDGPHPPPFRNWASLMGSGAAGGGRVDGAFLTEPGSYEDFHYSLPFDMGSFGQSPPSASAFFGGRPFSPFGSTSAGAHSPYPPSGAPFSSFSPPFASGSYASPPTIHGQLSPHSSHQHPPTMPPPDPAPLFDSTETALFSSFLNTLDVDPNFLFNPVLPPGMPSPPSTSMLQTGERREEDRREREMLGREVGGLDIGSGSAAAGLVSPTGRTADRVPPELPDELDEPGGGDDEDDEDAGENDPDFEPGPSRGTRRKSRGGPAAGTGREKKPRTGRSEVKEEFDEGEDVEMAAADDGDYVDGAGFTASGRPRRNARAPRRLSSSTATSATARPRPSLSRPPQPPAPPATLDYDPSEDADEAFESASATATASSSTPKVPLTESQKRNNHILSEQKRRNAIRSGFKDLVDLLVAGEQASGIVLGGAEEDDGTGKKKKGKGTGRGRGRKGEVSANASKSVVLTKASDYILWLERGNRALEQEVRRVQALLQHVTVQE
ncbi:putative HLH transcription factor [Rhodotorula toruloides ATCC 204091]|uniref:BY PROTMAP: gi/342320965/gb/EGU12903.1/ putative HLH transcription factor [Rhodotorula glutinis ATCC 204091] n=1 Tax=Rhodotorula toruloides TaxID=5286 RepID=A0A0K3CEH0_RHOTO|nr:putative HLH transcription factor [Rhodotorula toruloides ATCC 204091]KAK4334378.1 putative HLH transcription factor [Rhodotorula toruloides]PRQ75147.1 hypothetical protein AAT19DRAFT_14169 [Rhodotorula toruloides]